MLVSYLLVISVLQISLGHQKENVNSVHLVGKIASKY
jgi:hypothetical protein